MKQVFIRLLFLCGYLPFSSTAQIGVADPATGNAPINFYGRVLDQDGEPLAGVKVTFDVRIAYPNAATGMRMGEEKSTPQSDANGNFTLTGMSGYSIKIESVEKIGYKLSDKFNHEYVYSWSGDIFHPDPNNPVIFKMWKQIGSEHLITGGKFYAVNPDGRPYTLNLLEDTKSEGTNAPGDIIVRVHRPQQIKPRTKFDWSYSIDVVDGGIIHTNDDFMYRAPEAGYKDKYEFTVSAASTNWLPEVEHQQFYVKTRNGRVFGCLEVRVIPDYNDHSVFDVHYAANPSGSRNLER
jgi:hypothetical protein